MHNACLCMGTHSQPLLEIPLNGCLRNLVGMNCSWPGTCIILAIPAQGGKIGHGGSSPSSKNFFRPEGFSNKLDS